MRVAATQDSTSEWRELGAQVTERRAEVRKFALGLRDVTIGVRPEALELRERGISAHVEVVEELGADAYAVCIARLPQGDTRLIARCDYRRPPARGSQVTLMPRVDEVHVFDPESGERLGE